MYRLKKTLVSNAGSLHGQPLLLFCNHSVRKLLTGLVVAAFTDW